MLVFLVLARHGWCIGLITALRSRKTNRRSDGDGATMNELLQGSSHIFIKKKFGSSSMHEAWWLHLDGPGTFGLQVKPVVNLRISFLPWFALLHLDGDGCVLTVTDHQLLSLSMAMIYDCIVVQTSQLCTSLLLCFFFQFFHHYWKSNECLMETFANGVIIYTGLGNSLRYSEMSVDRPFR